MNATLIVVALGVGVFGLLAALIVPKAGGRLLGFAALAGGAALALIASLRALAGGFPPEPGFSAGHVTVHIDATAAFFVAIVSAISASCGLYALGGRGSDERKDGRAAAAAANLIWIGSTIVCVAGDVWFLIFGWELVALGFYAAIAYGGDDENAGIAAYYTLVLTHVAGAGIVAGLLVLAHAANSYAVIDAAAAGAALAPAARAIVFFILLGGFGAKVGLLPLQGWLPYGYPAAPASVAALMAGGALNIGFYGIARFLVGFGGPVPLWWGIAVVTLGALGAFLGIAWAQAQRDLRALAAYSSVENSGLIVLAFGVALIGRSTELPLLVGVAIAAAYIQIGAHAFAKSLLFLCISGIRRATGTSSFERLGGLIHRLPVHSIAALVAATSLAALPPLGGFAGEWLILESCMQGFRTHSGPAVVTMALAGAMVGLSAGIAVVAFVKVVGVALLGAPRSREASRASERLPLLQATALGALGLAVVGLGVATPWYLHLFSASIDAIAGTGASAAITASPPLVQPAFAGFSSESGLGLGATIALSACVFALLVAAIRRPATRVVLPWTSGATYEPWTQYTGTGFANPTRVILDAAVRTVRETASPAPFGFGDEVSSYESVQRQFFGLPLAEQIAAVFLHIAAIVRRTQSGVIAAYLSYILAFAIGVLIFYPSIRRW